MNTTTTTTTTERDALRSRVRTRYETHGQGHVLRYLDSLSETDELRFLRQLDGVESLEGLSAASEAAHRLSSSSSSSGGGSDGASEIEPFDASRVFSTSDAEHVARCRAVGERALSEGTVCALVLAGGQGTRLGFDGPKGCYPLTTTTKSCSSDGRTTTTTLFRLIAERLVRLGRLRGVSVPWYVMTSPSVHDRTVSFFEESNFFGLNRSDVFFFRQGTLPCLDEDGRMILETPSRLAEAPDGNGGVYAALRRSGAIDDMRRRGIRHVHAFAVDNALARPADPVFVGHCASRNADCGNKVLWRRDANEKVGVLATRDGRPLVVEYSDLDPDLAKSRDETTGDLVFGAANVCNHYYHVDFLARVSSPDATRSAVHHVARKRIPAWDPVAGVAVAPSSNNGVKLERFIFDVFPSSERMTVLRVERREEFAPVKNAPGSPTDAPEHASRALSDLARAWVTAAGGVLDDETENDDDDDDDALCYVSPLTSYAGEGLEDVVATFENRKLPRPFRI